MNWLAKAKARFSQKCQTPTDKTDETGVLAVLSVPTGSTCEISRGISSVSSVGVTGIFENCISAQELIAAAMRASDHWNDGPVARQQMVKDCLDTPLELRPELLDSFFTNYPKAKL